jgi:DNA-directed RNA polymerase subunit M/transcription elongation factor TFIIS
METLDPAAEWRRLAEHYRTLTDEELLDLSHDLSDTTEVAKQALTQEITQRRLKPSAPKLRPLPGPAPAADDVYADDRELVPICTVWSLSDARKLQRLLNAWGIPFYMGPEKAMVAEAVTSSFQNGVDVEIMRVGWPWARQAMRFYEPEDEPPPTPEESADHWAIRCPKCRSKDAIFERLQAGSANSQGGERKFEWTCGSCGYSWLDEGVMTKA